MWQQIYNVVLKTPIGPRYGTMEIHGDQGTVDGSLNVLMGKNTFHGSIDEGNRCQITGQLRTLMRTILYTAAGNVTWDSVCLTMRIGNKIMEVTGTALPGKEGVRP